MHICYLTNEYPKQGFPHGGLGSFVKTIAEALVKKGIQVTVVGLNYTHANETESLNGVTVVRVQKSQVKGLAWYFNSRTISKTIADLHLKNPIHVVEGAELFLAFLPKFKEIKYVIRLHGGHHFFAEGENRGINWWKGFQEKRSFKKADAFVAVSNYVKEHTAKYLSYNDKVIKVIFNPINSQLFQPQSLTVDPNNITFAGTLCEKKGVRQLIQSFPFIKEKYPEAVLNLYGRDWFFPDGSSYMKMLQEVELPKISPFDKDVIFHGSIDYHQIPEVYAKATVCVFPSHMETLGLVAPEAMAMEKAVVFTQLGPGPEVIEDGITGLLCNPHDPKDVACKINRILSDPDFANQLGKKARNAVLNSFESAILVEKNIQFYKNLI